MEAAIGGLIMKMRKGWLLAALITGVLTGCGSSETASLVIDGPDTALTLERIKPYIWSDAWQLQLVVRRFPDCQRRHNLADAPDGFKVELYSPAPGAFIIKQGKRWYVTDLKSCNLQTFKEAPPEPGMPVGTFVEKDGTLRFQKAPQSPVEPAPASAPAAAG
jgi:hypothetical protein